LILRGIIIDQVELQIGRLDLPSEGHCSNIHARQVKAKGKLASKGLEEIIKR
jgi:hypothetical protein